MNYVVFDLEWNQGKAPVIREKKEDVLSFEIIEIGAVMLDEKRKITSSFHRIIRPVVHTKLYEVTKQIIGLTETELQAGVSFQEAVSDFFTWCGAEYRFCTWGISDLSVLQRNLAYFNIKADMPYPLFFCDVQQLYSIAFEENSQSRSLEYAVRELQISTDKPFHGALSDAEYTAAVFQKINPVLIRQYPALDTFHYPKSGEKPIRVQYPDSSLFVSATYETKKEVRRVRQVSQLYCYICGKKSKRILPWFSYTNTKGYDSLGFCKQHGLLKGRLLIKNPLPGQYFGIQTVRSATDEEGERMKVRYKDRNKRHKESEKANP